MRWLCITLLLVALPFLAGAAEVEYRAGVAKKVITPGAPIWMAGYAARDKPSEGKVHELYAKALAIEDAKGDKVVLLTTDLIGLPRDLTEAVAAEVKKQTGLDRARLMFTTSHTHCGPVIAGSLTDMYDMPDAERKKVDAYAVQLQGWLAEVMVAAVKDLKPARLAIGRNSTRFAVNRREPVGTAFNFGRNMDGPVDHDVPVLRVQDETGKQLRAVVFGYACHNTTLAFFQLCGDYAGFAQQYLEEKYPDAVAMFWSGCGGDANPTPRRELEHARTHGRALADAVEDCVRRDMDRLTAPITARYATIPLTFASVPTKDKLMADLLSKQYAVRTRAARYLKLLEGGGKIDDTYPHYPIQVWRVGDQLVWIALGGEVTVDYALAPQEGVGRQAAGLGGRLCQRRHGLYRLGAHHP